MRPSAAVFISCLALAAQAQIAQQPTTRPEDLCTIEGSVTNAATGAPVKKATILMMRSDVTPTPNALPQTYSTTTDASGKYAMKDLEPGKYTLRVSRNGFVATAYGARGRSPIGAMLTLGPGQKMKDIDVRLVP